MSDFTSLIAYMLISGENAICPKVPFLLPALLEFLISDNLREV